MIVIIGSLEEIKRLSTVLLFGAEVVMTDFGKELKIDKDRTGIFGDRDKIVSKDFVKHSIIKNNLCILDFKRLYEHEELEILVHEQPDLFL